MDQKNFFKETEQTVKERGLSMTDFYRIAGIHQTTWMRWKKGQGYHSCSKKKIDDALR